MGGVCASISTDRAGSEWCDLIPRAPHPNKTLHTHTRRDARWCTRMGSTRMRAAWRSPRRKATPSTTARRVTTSVDVCVCACHATPSFHSCRKRLASPSGHRNTRARRMTPLPPTHTPLPHSRSASGCTRRWAGWPSPRCSSAPRCSPSSAQVSPAVRCVCAPLPHPLNALTHTHIPPHNRRPGGLLPALPPGVQHEAPRLRLRPGLRLQDPRRPDEPVRWIVGTRSAVS